MNQHLFEELLQVRVLFDKELHLLVQVSGVLVGHDVVEDDKFLVDVWEELLVLVWESVYVFWLFVLIEHHLRLTNELPALVKDLR